MAFLCPVRIPRRRRKRRDGENATKSAVQKGRITGSNSVDSLVALGKDNDEDEIEFEPRKMVVLHDFIPCVEDEIPVQRGEHVKALYQETDWIYILKLDDKEGFIPYTYCVTEEEYEKRKEKQKPASPGGITKDFLKSPLIDAMVTQSNFEPAEFAKQNHGQFIVKFDFDASEEDDVSVRKGEIVQVLNKDDVDWYWIRKKSGKEGFIPKDFITKFEQTEPSRTLMNRGQISRSNPNIYSSSKMSPQSVVIAASSYTSFSRTEQTPHPVNTSVIPLSSTKRMDYSSSATNSSRSSSQTPVLSADQSSTSLSRFEHTSPYSNHVPSFVTNTPDVKTSYPSSSKAHDGAQNVKTPLSQADYTRTTPNPLRFSAASTLLITDENQNLKHQNPKASFKPFSSMSRIDQRDFVTNTPDTYQLSQSLGRNYNRSRRKSNDLLLYGQELVCTDTHVGREEGELTVYKGDWIYADMKCRDGRGWVWAYSPASKTQGFVPKACLRPPATTPL